MPSTTAERALSGRTLAALLVALAVAACSSATSPTVQSQAPKSSVSSATTSSVQSPVQQSSASSTPNYAPTTPAPTPGHITMRLEAGPGPVDVAAGFGSIWVTNHHGASVTRLDPSTGRVLATIPVGTQPASMTIGAGSIWTANYDGTIGRINPTTNQSVSIGQFPHLCGWPTVAGGAIWVYVCDVDQPYVARVDIATGKTTATIPAGSNQSTLLWADDVLWMTTFPDGELLRLDPRTGAVLQRISLPGCPVLGRQSYAFGSLWVSLGFCSDNSEVLRLNPKTGAVEAPIKAVAGGSAAVGNGAVWLGDGAGTIDRIDPTTLAATTWTKLDPIDGLENGFGALWAVSFDAETVWKVDTAP